VCRDRASDDTKASADDSCRTDTCDGSAKYQGIAVVRKATDQASCLEDDDACQEDGLEVEVFVQFSPE
jgi:hypothetical protein